MQIKGWTHPTNPRNFGHTITGTLLLRTSGNLSTVGITPPS